MHLNKEVTVNKSKVFVIIALVLSVIGCSSTEEVNEFDKTLYSGKPIDSLTSEDAPKTEIEAIQRGDAALQTNNIDLALYEYIRSLSFKDGTKQADTLFTVAQIHLRKNNGQLAERALVKSLEYNPSHIKSLELLGVINSKRGLNDEAIVYFLRAINSDQERLGSTEVATSYVDMNESTVEALKYDSKSPERSYIGLGILSDVNGDLDIAKRYYEKALEINPSSSKAIVNLAYSHYMSGNYYLAQRMTNRALKMDPNNERAINNLALIYIALGENRQALSLFERNMDTPEALNNLGYFLILNGRSEEAVPYLQQAIDKRPSYYKVANENLERALSDIRSTNKQELEN
ncbi:hypothetical protein BCT07_06380 [Vibrio breoganii]|uniref:tetratricopeptide repeat protein n=1 Tax=Vibrio breoganii TaxID=553239 RepID=UPI000C82D0AE|nr:hypothetical protein BCU00_07675 [Vibrio breoganii]PMO51314.1 hypothetical protein BCT07_06380 [Vibrio breoganii]